jgi:hypothetical protein
VTLYEEIVGTTAALQKVKAFVVLNLQKTGGMVK